MRTVNKYTKNISYTLALLVTATALLLTSAPRLQGSEFACEVIGIDRSAWIVRGDSAVKITPVEIGDVLHYGDTLTVVRGNSVDLAFDAQKGNVLHIAGQAEIRITKGLARQLEMKQGQMVAFLDNPEEDRNFKVVTPTAVAAVRGTRFMVETLADSLTRVATYQGAVQVSGKDADGKEKKEHVLLKADNKTLVDPANHQPLVTLPLSADDRLVYDTAKTSIELSVSRSKGSAANSAAANAQKERDRTEETPDKLKYL